MLTPSKNFRTSLFAAVLTVATLAPTMPAHAVETPVKAKARTALQVGRADFKADTPNLGDLSTHVLDIRFGSHPAQAVAFIETVKPVKPYGFDECFRDCTQGDTSKGTESFCMFACN